MNNKGKENKYINDRENLKYANLKIDRKLVEKELGLTNVGEMNLPSGNPVSRAFLKSKVFYEVVHPNEAELKIHLKAKYYKKIFDVLNSKCNVEETLNEKMKHVVDYIETAIIEKVDKDEFLNEKRKLITFRRKTKGYHKKFGA